MTEQLLGRGDRVVATLRRVDALDGLRTQYGEKQLVIEQLDVTDPIAVHRVIDDSFGRLGSIDVIVNNAGYGLYAAIEEPTREQILDVLNANLLGSIDVIRAALPHLRSQGGGRILQLSSVGGQLAFPGFGYYHAAKWGIEAICETLAAEVAQFGIGVTLIEPGMTPTGFNAGKDLVLTMPEYDDGAFGEARQQMREGNRRGPNDPAAIVRAIIASADAADAPLRLPLGVDAYYGIHAAYTQRLALLEQSREIALSVGDGSAQPWA